MKRNGKTQQLNNVIGQKAAEAFGYSEEQLTDEYDRVAAESASQDQADTEASNEAFERLLSRVHESERGGGKIIRLKQVAKVLIVVAAMAGVVLSTGTGASGERAFRYGVREPEGENQAIWNNVEEVLVKESEEDAYQRIGETLGIRVMQLMDRPQGMEYGQVKLYRGYARMEFLFEDHYVYFTQMQLSRENSTGVGYDYGKDQKVYNRQLEQEILIGKSTREDGMIEFSAEVVYDKAGYRLEGIVGEEEFKQMVEKIAFYN